MALTPEEYEIMMDLLRSTLPQTKKTIAISPEDRAVWEHNDLRVLVDFFEEVGLGYYRGGDLTVAGPSSLTQALVGILPEDSAPVVTGYITAFGSASAQLQDGTVVLVNPITQQLYVMQETEPPSSVEIVISYVSDVDGALKDLKQDPLLATDKRSLLKVARQAVGPLEYMEAYGLRIALSRGGIPDEANIYRAPLNEVLAAAHPFETITTPPPDPNNTPLPLGEGWADDWEE